MKKNTLIALLLIVLVVALTGCKKEKPEEVIEPNEVVEQPVEVNEDDIKIIMDEFNTLTKGDTDPTEIVSYVDNNIKKVSTLEGDLMIDSLEQSLDGNIEELTNIIFATDKDNELMEIAGKEIFFPEGKIKDIKNDDLKDEISKVYKNMYKLVNLEGEFYPIIDYTKLKTYEDQLSPEWNSYLSVRAMDSEKIPFADGGMVINFDELADRILRTERHLNTYVEGFRQEELLELYKSKLTAYMKGLPNTPISNYSDNVIFDDVLGSYEETAKKEGHITAFTVAEYLETIEANKSINNDRVKSKADELITEAVRVLTEYK
ncbi:MAG: hypothetical protein PHY91_08620 [Tissierellia bacterium]|nr:hypothetical protein [Tissierellia bacterium]MDD4725892.1 hypothetical protein [Tissierellia bacterium]